MFDPDEAARRRNQQNIEASKRAARGGGLGLGGWLGLLAVLVVVAVICTAAGVFGEPPHWATNFFENGEIG